MQIFVETDRLILREVMPQDVDGFFELDSDPEVHRYLGSSPFTKREQSEAIVAYVRQQYIENGIGRWTIIEKKSNRFVGWSGLKFVRERINNHIDYYDIGYRLKKEFWGRGYATETAIASLHYGFENMKLQEIVAAAHIENMVSNHIIKKLGFTFVEQFYFKEWPHNWYTMSREEWQKRKTEL